ncbi:MAG: type II secretion system protein [Candidatus Hydrogenedens sp.]|nr:type II secretion system protein [Candidatus Hydrogenedens sp.]
MKKNKGFTLIELMIVVAIIAIIAAIAIPNLLRSRVQSNESATIGNLKTILGAQVSYQARENTYGAYADLIDDTDGPSYLDDSWEDGVAKSGFTYAAMTVDTTTFYAPAAPESTSSGTRGFAVDETGVIRWEAGEDAPAKGEGTVLGQADAA